MKKLILVFLMALAPLAMQAQTDFLTDGIVHNIAPGYISGDSVHTIGIVDMQDGVFAADSFAIVCEPADSLNIRYYVVPLQDLSAETVADSVAGVGFNTNVATGGYQFTADGYGVVPWHNILAGIGSHRARARLYRVYARVFAVGSEVASSGKKFKTRIRMYR